MIELDYYKTVIDTQTDAYILREELRDLWNDIQQAKETIKKLIEQATDYSEYLCGLIETTKDKDFLFSFKREKEITVANIKLMRKINKEIL